MVEGQPQADALSGILEPFSSFLVEQHLVRSKPEPRRSVQDPTQGLGV
jgi:hypothetical protein